MKSQTLRHMFVRSIARILGISESVYQAIGGRGFSRSGSGVNVSTESAMNVAAYKACVELLSTGIGKTAFEVNAGLSPDVSHQAFKLVRRWARHHQLSAFEFRRVMMVHALMTGNGYGYIVRENSVPVQIRILDPTKVKPEMIGHQLRYKVDGRKRTISASDIIHIKGFGTDGWCGIDPIRYWARETLGLAIATQNFASDYYQTGGVPHAYLKSEAPLTDEQYTRMEGQAERIKEGVQSRETLPLLENTTIETVALSAEQTQFLKARETSALEIAVMLRVPPHKVGLATGTSYGSLEEENKAFRDDALEPWLCQFESEYRKLLKEDEQEAESHSVEPVRFDLMKNNTKDRAGYLKAATGGAAWFTPNDARRVEGMAADPNGKELRQPLNTGTASDESGDTETGDEGSTDADSGETDSRGATSGDILRQFTSFHSVTVRMARRLARSAESAAKDSRNFLRFLDNLDRSHRDVIHDNFHAIVALCCRDDEAADQLTRDFLLEFRELTSDVYDKATPAEFTDQITAAVSHFVDSRDQFTRRAIESWSQSA